MTSLIWWLIWRYKTTCESKCVILCPNGYMMRVYWLWGVMWRRNVCEVWTQDPENFDEEVKSLVTAWYLDYVSSLFILIYISIHLCLTSSQLNVHLHIRTTPRIQTNTLPLLPVVTPSISCVWGVSFMMWSILYMMVLQWDVFSDVI